MKKKIATILLGIIAIFSLFLIACGSDSSEEEDNGMIEIPFSSSELEDGMQYTDAEEQFKNAGFTNIKLEKIEDLVTGWLTDDGEIEEISVNGDTEFSEGDEVEPDSNVVIRYHTFPEEDADNEQEESANNSDGHDTTEGSEEVITINNNDDFSKILSISDPGDPFIKEFANKYYQKTVEFDGCIASVSHYKDYDTRYNLLIYPGNYDANTTGLTGPSMIFENVGINGYGVDASFIDGQNVHVIAKVGMYNDTQQTLSMTVVSLFNR